MKLQLHWKNKVVQLTILDIPDTLEEVKIYMLLWKLLRSVLPLEIPYKNIQILLKEVFAAHH